jgi:hypothetical protein
MKVPQIGRIQWVVVAFSLLSFKRANEQLSVILRNFNERLAHSTPPRVSQEPLVEAS